MPATVDPWYRYGHRRAYVTADDGARIGYLDLETGEARDVPADRVEEFRAAIATWRRSTQADGAPPARRWVDLAENRPGQAAAEVAAAYRQAQPGRGLINRMFGASGDDRAGRVGAQGEAETARRLRALTDPGLFGKRVFGTWRVLHSVPVGAGIDHVVIGPPGVFVVDSKRHEALVTASAAAIFVGRRRTRYAEVVRDEADRAARLLSAVVTRSVPVTPLIAVVGAPVIVRGQPSGVTVVKADRLADWLSAQPARYPDDVVVKLYAIARRSTTWQP
jgi:hypothetical protein